MYFAAADCYTLRYCHLRAAAIAGFALLGQDVPHDSEQAVAGHIVVVN